MKIDYKCVASRKVISKISHSIHMVQCTCKRIKAGCYWLISKTLFEWRIAGGPIVTRDLCWLGIGYYDDKKQIEPDECPPNHYIWICCPRDTRMNRLELVNWSKSKIFLQI